MTKICIIQPLLAAYRLPVFEEMATKVDLSLIVSEPDDSAGYGKLIVPKNSNIKFKVVRTLRPFGDVFGMYQRSIISYLLEVRPDVVMIFSNPRYLSFWTTLICCRLLGIRVFPHGHGIFKKAKISIMIRLLYKLIFLLATRYVCYCDYVLKCFGQLNVDKNQLATVENSLVNKSPSPTRYLSPIKNSILFLGRIREGSKLQLLIEAVTELRRYLDIDFELHIVGGGPQYSQLASRVKDESWITLYGEIYDQVEIKNIADQCDIGVYPGDSGLSVVHYMSLGLPSVVHNDYSNHYGPEPTYIEEGVNGVIFSRDNKEMLINTLIKLYESPELLKKMQLASYNSYVSLINPSQAERFIKVLVAN